jgi:CRISPR-associated endonuclease Csn1
MKKILGLDLGTNSIGWSLVNFDYQQKEGEILGIGSRIIPMSQDVLDTFGSGISVSQTAERTRLRSVRRLRERSLLRRERLHRVLNILGFLPEQYAAQIDFNMRPGQFIPETEPKLAYQLNRATRKHEFLFKQSFEDMLLDFKQHQPQLVTDAKKVPYDWTIYFLRKKALTDKISKEELAWLLLHFNQKRGYYQLRGEEEEDLNKEVKFHALKVTDVIADEQQKGKSDLWYNIVLENGWIYRRSSKVPLFDWKGKLQEFIVTTELNEDKTVKTEKSGKEKRTFKAVDSEKDWVAIKKSTEEKIESSHQTVGTYIYENLLQSPDQKIKGKLVRTIERRFYKEELRQILMRQQELHLELQDKTLYRKCLQELYAQNEAHKDSISAKDFTHLFLNDILFYQRPLKSKKSLVSNCKFEKATYERDGLREIKPLKCIAKSHPLFQELRLWKFVQNLRIYQREKEIQGKLETDVDVTNEFLGNADQLVSLFEWLNERGSIDQKSLLKFPPFVIKRNVDNYRWNYVEDRVYPCNETRALIKGALEKIPNSSGNFPIDGGEEALWHILYSVQDKIDLEKALRTFALKHGLGEGFVTVFKKLPPFKREYGAYSAKAIKKLLPLMRMGRHWSVDQIHPQTKSRIERIIDAIDDESIRNRVREKAIHLRNINDFQGLPEWLASYIVYDRHSEDGEVIKWKTADDIQPLKQHSLRNPIVEQVINETLLVVRDIWKQYGKGAENFFDEIHIELGREMKNTKAERERISKKSAENENTNLRIKALLVDMMNSGGYDNIRPYSPMQQDIVKIYEEGALAAEEGRMPDDIARISKLAQPTAAELERYKLWLEQKYRSPYTGEIIPLSKLFTTAYEIEHVIPRARYFDDSFGNKIICEHAVNKLKGNRTAFEFIQIEGGGIVENGTGHQVRIFSKDQYEAFIKDHYGKNRGKMKRLLMLDVPEEFIQRQLNDTRYISRVVKGLLSNIVRDRDEQEETSRHVVSTNGSITNVLKQDWGLNDVWNEIITPRFERMNEITNSQHFGQWTDKGGKRVFQTQVPLEFQKGFSKKRIDHRHHALDALVIACASRDHINYLNNQSAISKGSREEKETNRYDLRSKLCFKKYNDNTDQHYKWAFYKPWETFTQDVRAIINNVVVTFKNSQRVVNKTVNHSQKWVKENGSLVKQLVRQEVGTNWAIRKPMHKDTVSGLVKLKFSKSVSLSIALDNWQMIKDKDLKEYIGKRVIAGSLKKDLIKDFKEFNYKWEGKDISKVDIYFWDVDKDGDGNNAASRVPITDKFDSSMIKYITDTGIQKIMLNHLANYNEEKNGKIIEHPELAFSPQGLDEMNANIVELNGGIPHKPVYKVRTFEPRGNKFQVGLKGNKKDKYVEAAKGTNLFFAIYVNKDGKRRYETIPLNIVIERQKQGLSSVPEVNESGDRLLMHLSPNDLVYVPTANGSDLKSDPDFSHHIYKMVSASGSQCFFLRHEVATTIVNKHEFGPNNKQEKAVDGVMIKEACEKLRVDRLGRLSITSNDQV